MGSKRNSPKKISSAKTKPEDTFSFVSALLWQKKQVVCIVGPAKSGKTHLIEQLIPELNRRGLRVATVKHTHHPNVSLDMPGKDTYLHRQAGAEIVALASPDGFSMLTEQKGVFNLVDIISAFPKELDIILVEGFKREDFPKIEIVPDGMTPVFFNDPSLLAVVSNNPFPVAKVLHFKPTDIEDLAALLTAEMPRVQEQI